MRILLAEDEHALSGALTKVLKRNNYSVDAVYDGCDAADYALCGIYDAIILDVMMPKKDGISVLKEIRGKGVTTPVLILTAKSEISDRVEGLDAGADDYLTKPFSMAELMARLRAITRRSGGQALKDLTFGNLVLDRSAYKIRVGENTVTLGHKEFQILEMLMINLATVVSAERFMEKIWGYDSDAEISIVWVYLSYIRRKLEQIGANVKIKVNRNVGYSLEISND